MQIDYRDPADISRQQHECSPGLVYMSKGGTYSHPYLCAVLGGNVVMVELDTGKAYGPSSFPTTRFVAVPATVTITTDDPSGRVSE